MYNVKGIEIIGVLFSLVLIIWEFKILSRASENFPETVVAVLIVGIMILAMMGVGFKLVLEQLQQKEG